MTYCHVPSGSDANMTPQIEAQVERFAPGFGDTILTRSTFSAQNMAHHNANLVGGDISGGAVDLRQLVARPAFRFPPHTTPMKASMFALLRHHRDRACTACVAI